MVMRKALIPNRLSSFGQTHVTIGAGIPLRQHHQGRGRDPLWRDTKARPRYRSRGSPSRTGLGEDVRSAAPQLEIARDRVGVEPVGIGQSVRHEPVQAGRGVAVGIGREGWIAYAMEPVGTPVEWPNHPVGVARRELTLPAVHPSSVESHGL